MQRQVENSPIRLSTASLIPMLGTSWQEENSSKYLD